MAERDKREVHTYAMLPGCRLLLAVILALVPIAAPLSADSVRILSSDADALEARVATVVAAHDELLVSSFIFGNDPMTMTAMALLRDAARRGVHVRVIGDAFSSHLPAAVVAHLQAEGIEIREYHPFKFGRLHWLTRRMHDKLLIADGRVLITGGRNIESSYYGLGRQIRGRNFVDTDVLVEGTAAADARRYFLALWDSGQVRAVHKRTKPEAIDAAARELDRHKSWLDPRIDSARSERVAATVPAIPPTETGPARFLHNPIDGGVADRKVGDELRALMQAARRSVVIESPYLVPTVALRQVLADALARGVRIRILTNSIASTDGLLTQAAYVRERRILVERGVELWEYGGPDCLHSKSAVIDGEIAVVGSYNLDPRSQNLNREVAVVVNDVAVAGALGAVMESRLLNSDRIDSRGWPEGADGPYPGVPRLTVWMLRLFRIVSPLLHGQL